MSSVKCIYAERRGVGSSLLDTWIIGLSRRIRRPIPPGNLEKHKGLGPEIITFGIVTRFSPFLRFVGWDSARNLPGKVWTQFSMRDCDNALEGSLLDAVAVDSGKGTDG
ncbi:hypothetical protein TNCT_700801 [Trichonephila clavata]|uniref:Uncharacterized protein n=1 Tax=Trichonephila clavata TaxID=2740835 RepID=A0A8X6G5Q8_TRICU|nr:hypothetical protein TNCT_700801 [Trichonephila clavata]